MHRHKLAQGFLYEKSHGHCYYCGTFLNPFFGDFTIEHVQPPTRGGSEAYDNLVPCCLSCNSSKGNKTLEEFRHACAGEAFWFERQGLALDYVPPDLQPWWSVLNRVAVDTEPLRPEWPDPQVRRVVSVLRKHRTIVKPALQRACSPYGIRITTLLTILAQLEQQGHVHRYATESAVYFRWTGDRV